VALIGPPNAGKSSLLNEPARAAGRLDAGAPQLTANRAGEPLVEDLAACRRIPAKPPAATCPA